MFRRASTKEEENRHLRRFPALKQFLLPTFQPAQEVNRLVCRPGHIPVRSPLFQYKVEESFYHQTLQFRAGGTADVLGQIARHLLKVPIVFSRHRGDLLRGGNWDAAVDHTDPPPFAFQPLVKPKEIGGEGQPVRNAVLRQEAVIKEPPFAASEAGTGQQLVQFRPFHPGVCAGLQLGRRSIQPAPVDVPGKLLPEPLQAEMRGEGGQPFGLIEPGELGRRVQPAIALVALPLQQRQIGPRSGQHKEKLKLIDADCPVIQNFWGNFRPQPVYNSFKPVIEPAHILDIGISKHIFIFPLAKHVLQGRSHGRSHRFSLSGGHAGQPFGKPLGQKTAVALEVRSHHFAEIGQLAGVWIGEPAVNDDAALPCRLVVPAQKGGHLRRISGKAVKIDRLFRPLWERDKIIIQFFQWSLLKHNLQSPSLRLCL